jgi:hypothetical protein
MTFNLRPTVALKYVLDAHIALPNYPTHQDFMFDVLSYIVRVTTAKSKDFDQTDIKFSPKTLKYVFGENLTPEFLDKIKLLIKDLVEDGRLTKKGEFVIISELEFLKFYDFTN